MAEGEASEEKSKYQKFPFSIFRFASRSFAVSLLFAYFFHFRCFFPFHVVKKEKKEEKSGEEGEVRLFMHKILIAAPA